MPNRVRLPAKISYHVCNLGLVSCSSLPSRYFKHCLSSSMKFDPGVYVRSYTVTLHFVALYFVSCSLFFSWTKVMHRGPIVMFRKTMKEYTVVTCRFLLSQEKTTSLSICLPIVQVMIQHFHQEANCHIK